MIVVFKTGRSPLNIRTDPAFAVDRPSRPLKIVGDI